MKPVKPMNEMVRKINETPKWVLNYHRLDLSTLRLIVISDPSFANNNDLSLQLLCIIILTDGTDRGNVLHYTSYK